MRYAVIDTNIKKCVNAVEWNGLDPWGPPDELVAVESDAIQIGDAVELVDGTWQKVEVKEEKYEGGRDELLKR